MAIWKSRKNVRCRFRACHRGGKALKRKEKKGKEEVFHSWSDNSLPLVNMLIIIEGGKGDKILREGERRKRERGKVVRRCAFFPSPHISAAIRRTRKTQKKKKRKKKYRRPELRYLNRWIFCSFQPRAFADMKGGRREGF